MTSHDTDGESRRPKAFGIAERISSISTCFSFLTRFSRTSFQLTEGLRPQSLRILKTKPFVDREFGSGSSHHITDLDANVCGTYLCKPTRVHISVSSPVCLYPISVLSEVINCFKVWQRLVSGTA